MKPFSTELQDWLQSKHPKTIAGLINASGEKSFAMVFLVLMAIPALPIPTGGVTHVLEVMVMLLCLEMIIGRRTIWLPQKWLHRPLGKTIETRSLPYLIRKIEWLEKYSHPRWNGLLNGRLIGLVVLTFTIGAFVSPPFSGLDTIPSIGVVLVALGVILEDSLLAGAGLVIGTIGVGVELFLGAAVVNVIGRLF